MDWYPWGEAAFQKARAEDKPIFLSIGYSACHWCHVMERESFENDGIAAFLNQHYVSIKVDREEHPEVDDIYMNAVQMMTGSGGWPLSVFLTPDLKPFYGGTYFPPEDRFGRPGFSRVLQQLIAVYRNQRDKVDESVGRIMEGLQTMNAAGSAPGDIDPEIARKAYHTFAANFDAAWGGFGAAPKFPPTGQLEIALLMHHRDGAREPLLMVEKTLQKMAQGGMFDHLGGGFHRYSVDAEWRVPHFEKMLYDNALIAMSYLEAYQATGNAFYADIARRTLDWVLADMRDEAGGFHSALDADSEGEEGKYYTWSADEIVQAVGPADGALFCEAYGVTADGNFEGSNILYQPADPAKFAETKGIEPGKFNRMMEGIRGKLLIMRSRRVPPARDDKVLTDWNGLMIASLARGYRVLGDGWYLDAARGAANFISNTMWDGTKLKHRYRQGEANIEGTLDDYAFVAWGCVELYQAGFEEKYLRFAEQLGDRMVESFWDDTAGGFYQTRAGRDDLIERSKSGHDGSIPAGNAIAARALLALYQLLDRDDYRAKCEGVVRAFASRMSDYPSMFLRLAGVADALSQPLIQIAIVGDLNDGTTQSLLKAVNRRYISSMVLAVAGEGSSGLPLFEGRGMPEGRPAAYFCRDFACQAPVGDAEELLKMIDGR